MSKKTYNQLCRQNGVVEKIRVDPHVTEHSNYLANQKRIKELGHRFGGPTR